MKKIIILSLILFLITGCDVTSNITISKNLEVKEEVLMTGTPEFFNRFYKNTPLTVIKKQWELDDNRSSLISNNYQYEIVEDAKPYPLVRAVKNYQTLEEFTTTTIFKDQYFKTFKTETNNNLVTITASDYKGTYDDEQDRYAIASFTLNIKVPYVVTDSNADSFNASKNIYTWNIKSDTKEKEIKLTFDKNKVFVYNLAMYISIGIIILIIILIIFIVLHFINRSKRNNRTV